MPKTNHSLKIALASLAVSVLVLAIKYAAYYLTGSVALYSDALESIINVATAAAAIVAIRIAAAPPDDQHPYGHHKAEYLAAVAVGVMIVIAALGIMRETIFALLSPTAIAKPWLGLAVTSVATLLNVLWGRTLIWQGKRHRSAVLVADGKHLLSDVLTSLGVLVGVTLTVLTGIQVLDAIIAGLVALHVLYNGWGVIRESASGLMDEALPAEDLARIRQIISQKGKGALEAHALRTRHAGKVTFIDFHLVVPDDMSAKKAHDICDRIETALKEDLYGAFITIHVEPKHKAKNEGIIIA